MDEGCEEVLWQGKDSYNSRKLRKTVAIYKTTKLVFSKNLLLKTGGLEKVPYSESSSKIIAKTIFFNQPIRYFLWTNL